MTVRKLLDLIQQAMSDHGRADVEKWEVIMMTENDVKDAVATRPTNVIANPEEQSLDLWPT